jgi:hypothetical protein
MTISGLSDVLRLIAFIPRVSDCSIMETGMGSNVIEKRRFLMSLSFSRAALNSFTANSRTLALALTVVVIFTTLRDVR